MTFGQLKLAIVGESLWYKKNNKLQTLSHHPCVDYFSIFLVKVSVLCVIKKKGRMCKIERRLCFITNLVMMSHCSCCRSLCIRSDALKNAFLRGKGNPGSAARNIRSASGWKQCAFNIVPPKNVASMNTLQSCAGFTTD